MPRGQPRPRGRAIPIGGGKFTAQMYHPERERGPDGITRDCAITVWRRSIEETLSAGRLCGTVPQRSIAGPLIVQVEAFFPRPQELLTASADATPIPHEIAPDRDNLDKPILDVMQAMGIIINDGQACRGEVQKWYCGIGCQPGAIVTVASIPGGRKPKGQGRQNPRAPKPVRLGDVVPNIGAMTWIRAPMTLVGSTDSLRCLREIRSWLEKAEAAVPGSLIS